MRALTFHGSHDVRIDRVAEPRLQEPDDLLLRVTATAICGSDLHLYRGKIPMVEQGDILGHEFMGVVEEVGSAVTAVRPGDRVVVPFVIACGECFFCRLNLHAACETTNPGRGAILNKKQIPPGAALYGYSHLYGGVPGGQAEYVRVPKANSGPFVIPDVMEDERVLFLSDILPTGYQAVRNAGLEVTDANRERIGVAMGSGIGGLTNIEETSRTLHEQGPRRISPFFVPGSIINMISGFLSIHLGLQGPNYALTTACTTGTHSIGMAARNIAYGEADVMVAGGSEMAACGLGLGGFGAARALSTRNDEPTRASRPWDRDRDGFVLSDGSGALVLEELEHARARGARIYAELVGFGMSGDAFHMTAPPEDGAGAARCMKNALRDAGLDPRQVDYINAHGTSTPAGDIAEIAAVSKKKTSGNSTVRCPTRAKVTSMMRSMVPLAWAIPKQ